MRYPQVTTVHFWSDGPSKPTSHGKGTPDSIGGTVKRTGDNLVLRGNGMRMETFFEKVSISLRGFQLFYTAEEYMLKYDTILMQPLKNRFPQEDKYTRSSQMRTGSTTDNYPAFAVRCWFARASAQPPSISMDTQRNSRVIQGGQRRKDLWPC